MEERQAARRNRIKPRAPVRNRARSSPGKSVAPPGAGSTRADAAHALFDARVFGSTDDAIEFIETVLEGSTEYSIIGKDLSGTIVLWNEGARRLYGYEPHEVVGHANSQILHVAEDVEAGRPAELLETALREGKWEGTLERQRKDGSRFTARLVITPRRDAAGEPIGYVLISKDISEEARLTKELEESQVYTRSLIESSIDALMTTDPLGVITDVNGQMERLTGHSRRELLGTPFKHYFSDPERADDAVRKVLRDGSVTNYELTACAPDGHETVVSYNASTLHDREGRLQGVLAAARDITEHKQLEERLRTSQAYNRGLIEASADGLITVGLRGSISDVNEQMCRLSGYAREELIGSRFAEYFASPEAADEGVRETLSKGVVTDYVLQLTRSNGETIEVSFNASVFDDANGEIGGIFASARDITQQAGLQRQLAEERAYNRGLIEAALDGLVTVDPMLTITDVNETMCRMAGYKREQLIGSPFPDYFTEPALAAQGVRLTLDEGSAANYELVLRSSDGQERLVSLNAAVFNGPGGDVRGIFASARDVTDQAILKAQLEEEQAYNRGLIEASVDGLVTIGRDMRITDVNETMCRMLGRPRRQVVGSLFPTYFSERALAAEGVSLTFEQGSVTNYVLTLHGSGDSTIPVSFNAAVFSGTKGEVRGVFAAARDISDQRDLEERLRETQAYTRSLIESNIDALMTTDSLGVVTDVNEQMEQLTGHTREELIDSPARNYFTEPERLDAGIKQTISDGEVTNYELTVLAKDGHATVVSYNASTFTDPEGKLRGVFAAARDVTEHKELERRLRVSEEYNRGLIEASVDGLVTVDPDGFITDVNRQMCEMTGYTRDELLGTPFSDYFTDPEHAMAGVKQTLDNEIVTEYGLTLVSRSRRQIHVSFNASVFRDASQEVRGIFASARDITDRVRLEAQLREEQHYLRGLIESSIDGLVTVDPEGFITDVNEQMCAMAEHSRERLVGSPFKDYFTEPDRAHAAVMRTLAEGTIVSYELVLKTGRGHKAVVSCNASVFRDPLGKVQGIFASARDISRQTHLQRQLVEQEAYNRSLIEASADALFAIAPDGLVTDVNASALALTGYSRKRLVNGLFADLFSDSALARAGVEETLEHGRVIGYDLELLSRYGRRTTVSFNAGVFRDSTGSPIGILAAARDITAQRELEHELRDSQAYTRSLIESNIDALMTTDPLGVITDVNGQMEQLTGHTRDELIGSQFKLFFTEPDRAEDGIRRVLRERAVTNYELTARAKDGTETVVSYNASTFTGRDGKLQGVFAAARDVTERREFEQQLQEKNVELEAASVAKDRFLASMSHELRTPLNAIIGFTGTLQMGIAGELNGEQERELGTVQSNAKHLLSIINDLLDLAKIESGRVELASEPVRCSEVIMEVLEGVRPLAASKRLELNATMPESDPETSTDRRALAQILLNLVSNALKFTESGQVGVELLHEPDATTIRVRDTGIGIAPEDCERLFAPFAQIDNSASRDQEGTGLGLHLSRKLADLLGATIAVESEPGRGSVFSVRLSRAGR